MISLINSNATAVPLATGSIHNILFSPPFYGLRDYGTGIWKGGDPDCKHQKQELRRGVNLADSVYSTKGGEKKVAEVGWIQFSGVCEKCGAVRHDPQIGQEELHDCLGWARGERPCDRCFVCQLRKVAAECWRILRDDGLLWVNLGDSFASGGLGTSPRHQEKMGGKTADAQGLTFESAPEGLKDLDLVGIPWRLAFALQADGWILRMDNIWSKPNSLPESVNGWRYERCRKKVKKSERAKNEFQKGAHGKTRQGAGGNSRAQREAYYEQGEGQAKYIDCPGCEKCEKTGGYILRRGSGRSTKSHEYVFQFAKTSNYYYDKYAVLEPLTEESITRIMQETFDQQTGRDKDYGRTDINSNRSARRTLENFAESLKITDPTHAGGGSGLLGHSGHFRDDGTPNVSAANGLIGKNRRSVWSIPTKPYPGAHFAVWPEELCQVIIKASTSEKGVCKTCGAPWVRIIDKGTAVNRPDNANDVLPYDAESGFANGQYETTLHKVRRLVDQGWLPSCECEVNDPVPAKVLDLFVGSGTTLVTARRLGRDGIGCDVNFKYLQNEAKTRLDLNKLEAFERGEAIESAPIKKNSKQKATNQLKLI